MINQIPDQDQGPLPPFLKEIFDIEIIVWSKNVEVVRCEVIVCKHAWRQCCQLASLMNLLMPRLMFSVCNKTIQQISFHQIIIIKDCYQC